MVIIFRQPGANIITTVDAVREVLPRVQAAIPPAIDVDVVIDQTTTIRASVHDIERALIISIILVVLVVFAFLRSPRTAMIPSVAVPLSLIGTFGAMYLLGYGIDNLSLMALTISTGFVVDDAIVVIENITRYREQGKGPLEAALEGAKEIGFTVMSMSLSLVAVFIPILLMSGIVGRLFREFAVTMAAAIVISMVVSLTATPMMCAHLLTKPERHGRLYQWSERMFAAVVSAYGRTLDVVLRYAVVTLLILIGTIGLTGYLFLNVSKGFFPQQDTGRLNGAIQADQGSSFQLMNELLLRMMEIVRADPAASEHHRVQRRRRNDEHGAAVHRVEAARRAERARRRSHRAASTEAGRIPGATLYLQSSQDVRVGGRQSNAQHQFTMQGDNLPI
jgi:multidrug efflux pump